MDERCDAKPENEEITDIGGLRTVVIEQGDNGYGLTVSGENPVAVEGVKEGGPAATAGVKKGDALIRVNDRPVSKYNHKDVVMIIKSTHRVKLTLRSKELDCVTNEATHKLHLTGKSSGDLITAPLPVNLQLQSQFEGNKVKMLHVFLDKQRKVKENILLELQKKPSKIMQKNLGRELEVVNRQISKIMEELNIKEGDIQLHSHPRSFPRTSSSAAHPHSFHPYSKHTRSSSEVSAPTTAPPLPARNRSLVSQISAPNITPSPSFSSHAAPYNHSFSHPATQPTANPLIHHTQGDPEVPPPLPPRPPHLDRSGETTNALSVENIPKSSGVVHSSSSGSDSSGRHNRIKSSPDPLVAAATHQNSPVSNRRSGIESIGGDWMGNWNKVTSVITEDEPPPGTPPPPYGGFSMSSGFCSPPSEEIPEVHYSSAINDMNISGFREPWASSILTMEEEDTETSVENHGPFQSLTKLISMKYNAYMAVLVNYVISNCDPSSLFFYMITDLYKEGGVKEMKKWAYEIHSSFLFPGAPMKLANVDESVLREIDETLQNSLDKEEILRKVFWKARQRSREDLNEQLADFRCKRSAGLGSLFGPADHILDETVSNKCKELSVVEQLLVPILDSVSEDLKSQTERMLVMASSLATILWKYFSVRSQQSQQLLDRCPLFVNKDRPLRSKLLRGSKKQVVNDHHFQLMTFYCVSHCNHCFNIIWGVAPQGYQCSDCEMNVHKCCVKKVEETCVGQVHRPERPRDTKLSSLIQMIMPEERERNRKDSRLSVSQIDRSRRGFEDGDIFGHLVDNEVMLGDRIGSGAGNKEQRRSDPGSGPGGHPLSNHLGPSNGNGPDDENFQASTDDADHGVTDSFNNASLENTPNNLSKGHGNQKKRSATSINRSESCKEKQIARKQVRENRKNSDPNIPTSKSGDVDGENHTFHSGSSSNSSLSQSQESPPGNTSEQIEAYASALDNDSDVEADTDLPDWSARLSPEVLEALTSKERKRQDTINEFFHTEQSHVRILKVLQFLFHQPLRQGGYVSTELMDSLFPNMDQILRLHTSFNKAMKKRRMETPLVTCIGDILTSMFAGEEGAQFQCAAAEFVSCQGFALESLKHQQKRDQKLALFLQDQENHPHCRRLQLKDMLPAGFQRLSKYPLLLESLLSYTDRTKHPEEYEQIVRALERSKEILAHVNTAVHNAENHKRLRDIQKKLDQNSLAKSKHGNIEELKGEFDLTKHNLIYEGPLTWKTARGQKNIDIHVLILEDCVVLLQKDSDKFILKYHSMNKSLGKDENKLNLSPIIKFGTCLCREVATDKCAIFIISTQSTSNAQIYELVTSSPMERSTWLRHLHEAQANYNAKEGRNRRSQPPPNLAESDEGSSAPADLKDVDDGVDGDNSESTNSTSENVSSRGKQENLEGGSVPHSAAPGTTSPETISNKTESGYTTAVSVPGSEASGPGTQPPAQGLSSPSGGPRRRLQEVQIIQIVEGPSLIQPSEVTVSQGVVLSAEPVLTPLELLRRKDLKIREELAEKQDLVADILNIPRRDFESVADVAGEAGLANKEPRELVLGAIFQAKRLQETLNETQNLREGAIIASHASLVDGGGGGSTPAYQTSFETMDKLLSISGALTQFLNSLMVLVSERDEERERMRRELVSSRDRVHQLHMQQQQNSNVEPTTATPSTVQPQNGSSSDLPEATSTLPVLEMVTPNSSRPSSFVYNNSFTTEHSESADLTNIEREDKYIEPVKSVAPEVTLPSDTPTTDSEKRNSGDVTGLSVSGGEDVGAVFGVKAPPNPPPEDSTNPPVEETKEGVVAT